MLYAPRAYTHICVSTHACARACINLLRPERERERERETAACFFFYCVESWSLSLSSSPSGGSLPTKLRETRDAEDERKDGTYVREGIL